MPLSLLNLAEAYVTTRTLTNGKTVTVTHTADGGEVVEMGDVLYSGADSNGSHAESITMTNDSGRTIAGAFTDDS